MDVASPSRAVRYVESFWNHYRKIKIRESEVAGNREQGVEICLVELVDVKPPAMSTRSIF